jgi:tetratricopeptide (TPR) repeat protein
VKSEQRVSITIITIATAIVSPLRGSQPEGIGVRFRRQCFGFKVFFCHFCGRLLLTKKTISGGSVERPSKAQVLNQGGIVCDARKWPHRPSQAVFRKETVAKTSLREVKDAVCEFKDVQFFIPLQRKDGVFFTVVCAGDVDSLVASLDIGGSAIYDLNRSVAVVRKFPLTMPEGSTLQPLVLKLRVSAQGSPSSSVDEGTEGTPAATMDDRYKALLLSLLDHEESGSLTSSASSFVMSLAKPVADQRKDQVVARGSAAETIRQAIPKSTAPRKALPTFRGPQAIDQKKYLVYLGQAGRVASVTSRIGSYVFFGSEIMTVDIAAAGEESVDVGGEAERGYLNLYQHGPGQSLYGYSQAKTKYGTSRYDPPDRPGQTGLGECERRAEQLLETVTWNEKEPGVVTELLVREGAVVSEGDKLCLVDCSERQQQLAHLQAADEIRFKETRVFGLNERFQVLTEKLVLNMSSLSTVDTQALLACCSDLERVVLDFMETARTYGKLIISEIHLPLEQKTIRPLTLGGVLGGAKYVVRGILFKIPDGSMFSSYPDPMFIANKVQGHELKGLKAYFGWFFNRATVGVVSFPLTAVIDFKGYRITAMTLLPISGSQTLIYGSDDAGTECNVRNDIPEWSNHIREASIGLNLKPHYVVNGRSAGSEAEIASCVDLEGHKGSDHRFYLLDFSRTFPPVFKKPTESYDKFWPFYNMMRGEFLKRWEKPLSADAFSNFQAVFNETRKSEAKANQEDIRLATQAIEDIVVVSVCKALFESHDASTSIRHILHREGLNMRYLGLVYQRLVGDLYQASKHNLYKLVQVEALMRVFKADLRACLRKAQALAVSENSESLLLERGAQVLNQYFGSSELDVWLSRNSFCMDHLVQKFGFKEKHARKAVGTFVDGSQLVSETVSSSAQTREYSFKFAVLVRLDEAMGLGVNKELMNELKQGSGGFKVRSFASSRIFSDADLKFEERVKHLDIVERARGLSEYLEGETVKGKNASEHLMKAFDIFESALEASPMDPWLSLLMGRICSKMYSLLPAGRNEAAIDMRNLFCDRAELFYRQAFAFEINPVAYLQFGVFLTKLENRLDEAEDYFLKTLEASKRDSPLHGAALIELVQVLEKKGCTEMAKEIREKTKNFVEYKESWMAIKEQSIDSSLRSSGLSVGRKRGKSVSKEPISRGPSVNDLLDASKSRIGNIRRALQKRVGGTIQKRKIPSGTHSAVETRNSRADDSSQVEGTQSEILLASSNSASQRSSAVEEDDEILTVDLAAAVSRNQKLREAVEEEDGEPLEVVPEPEPIDHELQTYLQQFMQRQSARKLTGSGSLEKYSSRPKE